MTPLAERWKAVPGYEGLYKVSSFGRVMSMNYRRTGRPGLLSLAVKGKGYLGLQLWKNRDSTQVYAHRLVLLAFVGEPQEGQECLHLDGNPSNNKVENLAWGTAKENQADRTRHGTDCKGESHPLYKLSDSEVKNIRALYASGRWRQWEIAERFGIARSYVSALVNRAKRK